MSLFTSQIQHRKYNYEGSFLCRKLSYVELQTNFLSDVGFTGIFQFIKEAFEKYHHLSILILFNN